ncbi:MAG TPA: ComF family protein [Pseudonocardiaceae bacterium]|jgi:predicted amidophosphoribosyltransferase|nr:ComF family protein [Pseudonocardiaceae bacterium]
MRDGLRALLDLVLPVACGGCGAPGPAWCRHCAVLLGPPVRVHPPCCPARPPVYVLGGYQGRLRAALLAYKEQGRRDLAVPLGGALAAALVRLPPESGGPCRVPGLPAPAPAGLCLVPVPSRWAAAARRGGQHVALLADRAAAVLAGAGIPAAVAPALRMAHGARDSVGLDRRARQANLEGRVVLRPAGLPPVGASVVLVDDVVTTGTTAAVCAARLLQVGVEVAAIVALAGVERHPPS